MFVVNPQEIRASHKWKRRKSKRKGNRERQKDITEQKKVRKEKKDTKNHMT